MGLHPTDLDVLLAKYPGDKVADFCAHIRKTVHEKPWTLVSYAWCFYMAVFSGGRWIRAELLKAGPQFWRASDEENETTLSHLSERGLSFWHFPGQFDGEDIKVEFKTRLAAAELLFTPDERVDIIEEAKNIMRLCATLVQELDDMVGADHAVKKSSEDVTSEKTSLLTTAEHLIRVPPAAKSHGRITCFIRQPKVIGAIVALGCLACVTLSHFQ